MGVDKATIGSPPWAHRVAGVLEAAGCRPVELQGGAESLAGGRWSRLDDSDPGGGPARALVDACERHPGSTVLAAACDLPNLDAAHVRALLVGCSSDEVRAYALDGRPNWSLVCIGGSVASGLARWGEFASSAPLGRLLADHLVAMTPHDPRAVRDIDVPDDLPGGDRPVGQRSDGPVADGSG